MFERIFKNRIRRFQKLMGEAGIDASVIRTLSSFAYFSGVKWLRPALLIPVEGEPVAFIFEDEAPEFKRRSYIRNVRTWRRVGELMRGVSGTIRESKFKVVGFDYSVERDSYVLFFELFKKLNRQIEVKDVHALIMQLRMIKDEYETELIRKASKVCVEGMKAAIDAVDVGISETDIAAEAVYKMMKMGSRHPLVYVNAGPSIRIHAEPMPDVKIKSGYPVSIVVAADHGGYYSDMARTVFVGGIDDAERKAMEAYMEAHHIAEENLKPGTRLIDIQSKVREHLTMKGYGGNFVLGFAHGVGLLIEEDPITTIVPAHRQYVIAQNMVLASIHAPITIPGMGIIKYEDTYIIGKEGANKITEYEYELTK